MGSPEEEKEGKREGDMKVRTDILKTEAEDKCLNYAHASILL